MCKACLVVAGVRPCASGRSAITNGLDLVSGGHAIVPSSVFVPSLAAVLGVTQVGRSAFEHARITSVIIHRHVQILCSSCFSFYKSLSSISFECDLELTRIESKAFSSSLESITIPRHVQLRDGSIFTTIGCPTSGVAQRAMRKTAPHVRGVSKARQF
jgi:hypothetical protein